MKLRSSYDNHEQMSDLTGLMCMDDSLAQQHQRDECDINNIVKKYMITGELPQHNMPPLTEDFEGVTSMQDAMDRIVEAREAFMQQPAEVRSKFNNDPALFVEFCSDESNKGAMMKMGLFSQDAQDRYINEENARAAQSAQDKVDAEAHRKAQNGPKS